MSKHADEKYEYLGDFSATPPWFSVLMRCDNCRVSWNGCWDNFECPLCGSGVLPWNADDPFDTLRKAAILTGKA